jgi:cytidine deaminase
MSSIEEQAAIEAAKAMRNSYSPYSKFKVGAALVSADDRIFAGTNVENASHGLTICAERSAISAAVTSGVTHFKLLALVSESDKNILPCGACLQVLSEFCDDLEIISINNAGQKDRTSLKEIFPQRFEL